MITVLKAQTHCESTGDPNVDKLVFVDFNPCLLGAPGGDKDINYIDSLDVAYIYIIKQLLREGYRCANAARDLTLRPRTFRAAVTNNRCAYIEVCDDKGNMIKYISFKSKFGIDLASLDAAQTQMLIRFSEAYNLDKNGLGADAYALFLRSIYREKENENANYGIVREHFPELPFSFANAKSNVAGYQIAVPGRYTDVYSYDIHRAYTYSMQGPTPHGLPYVEEGYHAPRGNQWCIYECVYTGRALRPGGIDWIPDERTHGTIWLPQALFADAQRDYSFGFFNVVRTYAFKTHTCLFSHFLDFLAPLDLDPVLGKYAKRLANALVGYLGRNPREFREVFAIENNEITRKAVNCPSKTIYPPAYINILDRHKSRFLAMLRAAGGINNIIYANTDGFMTRQPLRLDRFNVGMNVAPDQVLAGYAPIGALRLKAHYMDISIGAINQYSGIQNDGSIYACLAGVRPLGDVTPDQIEHSTIPFYYDIVEDGAMYRHYIRG